MGKGMELMRLDAPEHVAMLDDMKDQLLIVLIKRLADKDGKLPIPVAEIDDTGRDLLSFRVDFEARIFHFHLEKKQ